MNDLTQILVIPETMPVDFYENDKYLEQTKTALPIADTSALPRTELGRKLLALRKKAISKGMHLLSIDEVNLLVNESRGNDVAMIDKEVTESGRAKKALVSSEVFDV
jgi:hypothetical protein